MVYCWEAEGDWDPSHMGTVYCRVIFEVDTDLCCAAFLITAFETATDPLSYCFLEFLLCSGLRGTESPVGKSNKERVDPVPTVNSALLSVGTGRGSTSQEWWSFAVSLLNQASATARLRDHSRCVLALEGDRPVRLCVPAALCFAPVTDVFWLELRRELPFQPQVDPVGVAHGQRRLWFVDSVALIVRATVESRA